MLRISSCLIALIAVTTLTHAQGTVYKPGNGVSLPKVVRQVKPEYTPEAKNAGIQGEVYMRVVVLENGSVGEVSVTRSLDEEFGLDQQAVAAAKQWEFTPGTKDGKPVSVEITLEMTFRLK